MAIEIVDLPNINSMVDLSHQLWFNVYQAGLFLNIYRYIPWIFPWRSWGKNGWLQPRFLASEADAGAAAWREGSVQVLKLKPVLTMA